MKAIKGIKDETWQKFKMLAVKESVPMARLFEEMVESYKRSSEESWRKILTPKKPLTDEEARIMHETVKKIRSEYGFRV